MKHGECQSYFEIYKKYAKMLVLIKNEKLLGRAVIWEIDDAVYMDRVYVCMDYLIEAFIQYAQDHKWYYRQHQSLLSDGDEVEWLSPEDDYQEADTIDLEIEIHGIEEVPYMDSFRYFNQEANCITTVQNDDYDYLSSTDGSFGNRITETCPVCGSSETFNPDDGPSGMCWSEIDDCWYCEDCCVYSQTLDTYIRESRAVEVRMSRRFNDWIPEDDLSEEDLYVEIDGRWYSVDHDDVMFNEKTEEYYI